MLDFFNRMEYLEPRCPKCKIILDYGVNTTFSSSHKSHVCDKCEFVLK
ncbi:hypothetical protein HYU11_04320 [Candidatus Woesearchaeota archaeon]|nr:hypothetical protein [Candidatus Woesearchaeota archaeon]